MEISGIAFDCCWLMDLEHQGFDQQFAAMQLVDRMIRRKVGLLLDHEQWIDGEYYSNIKPHSVGGKMVEKLKKSAAISYVSGKPKSKCSIALESDRFDPSDIAYVGAAQNGNGVFITSEEKHLQVDRCRLIVRKCSVQIVGSDKVAELLS